MWLRGSAYESNFTLRHVVRARSMEGRRMKRCLCGERAVTPDNLCVACMLIRDAWKVILRTQRRYDRRCKGGKR